MDTAAQRKTKHQQKEAILVLGMHRSGTSMLAGILDRLGCMGPKHQMDANEMNPKGYFESKPIFELNDQIMEVAGLRWSDWQPLREGSLDSPRFNEFRTRAAEVVRAEYGDASMIYLKDPRICRLLPFWRDVLEDMGYRISCIHTHRHPADVAASLAARKHIAIAPSLGTLSWLRHTLDAEAASRGLPRIFTSYPRLLSGWQGLAEQAEDAFGFVWPASSRSAQARVGRMVDPKLRHHGSDVAEFLADPMVPALFRETLEIFENWAENGEQEAQHGQLDALRETFDSTAPLLYAPTRELEEAGQEIRVLAQDKATNAEAVEKLTGQLADAESARDQLTEEREELRATQAQLTEERERLAADLQDRNAAFDEARKHSEGALSQLTSQREQLRAENDSLTDRVIERDRKLAKLHQEVDQARREQAQAKAAHDALTAQIAQAEAARDKIRAEMETLTDRVIERDQKLVKMRQQVEHARHEQEHLHQVYRSSTSWRISAPVRAISRLLGGKRN